MGDGGDDGTGTGDARGTDDARGTGTGDARGAGDRTRPSRREFFRVGGAAAAGAAVGGVAGFAAGAASGGQNQAGPTSAASDPPMQPEGTIPPRPAGPGFDHLVVVMFENRSFDNLLGYLYSTTGVPDGQSFAGLDEGPFRNPDLEGRLVQTHPYTGSTDEIMNSPRPDPGEDYPHVNTQLFGIVDPPGNAHAEVAQMQAPFNAPNADDADAASRPPMDGFLRDYINNFEALHGAAPTRDEADVAMGSFSPDMLPVLSTLAREFAVFDHWHCAVPGPTFANRSFFHASTSHGFVTNHDDGGYAKWRTAAPTPTIFNRLEDAGISWCVYYDEHQRVSLTGMIHEPVLKPYWHSRFRPMRDFYQACAEGTLPAYAFIEPRMVYDHNDMHPPTGDVRTTEVDGVAVTGSAISDVRAGEALLHEIYTVIRASSTPNGSNAMNTMLLVTFDEHGGTFDHVPPPAAVPPEPGAGAGEMGFRFDRLGVRVPAIAVSAYTAAGRVVGDPMHHGSVISTLTTKYDLEPLTDRDRGAPTLDLAVTMDAPRPSAAWPQTHPQYTPRNPESGDPVADGDDDRPLSPPGRGLMGLLAAHRGVSDAPLATYRQAHAFLEQHGHGLFGPPE